MPIEPLEPRAIDPVRWSWPETQALAAALRDPVFEIKAPEYFCPSCIRRQSTPGFCCMCQMIRAAFPPTPSLFVITGPV